MPTEDEVFAQEDAAAGSTSQGVGTMGGRNDSGANTGGNVTIGTGGGGAGTGGTNDAGRSSGTSTLAAGGQSGGGGVSIAGASSDLVGAGTASDSGSGGASSVAASGASNGAGTGSGGESGSGGNSATGGESGSGGNSATGGALGTSGTSGTGGIVGSVGLVAYYPFDEASGQVAANLMDASMNGTYVGGCTHPEEGAIGGAVRIRNMGGNEFTSDWIELPDGILSDLAEVTLSIWVRDLSSARWGGRLFDFSRGADEAIYFVPDDANVETGVQGSHLGGIHDGVVFVDVWSTNPAFTDQAWHHVAVAWSSSGVTLYIDGETRGGSEVSGASPSDLGVTSPNWLGRTLDDAYVGLYAEIDELRIYDRVLADSDIKQLYRMR